MPKRVVFVTGGAGFLGSHLCERLLGEGFRVICADNCLTGNVANIRHLLKEKYFIFLKNDVTKGLKVKGRIDYVLHFASPASPEDYLKFPVETLEVGSLGTRSALDLAADKRAVFMLASTSEVYGDPLVHPQPEGYWGNVNPVGVRSCYDEAKRFSEALTMAYLRSRKTDTRIVRIFNTYGPRMRINDGRVVPNFIYQAIEEKPLTIYGDGRQSRSFCYVSDLIEGIYRLMLSDLHEPLNIGNPGEFTIKELARIVLRLSKSNSRIVFRPLPKDDPKQRRPDISRARALLKWAPKIKLEEGLRLTISWFKAPAP